MLNENIRGDQYTGLYPNRIEEVRRDSRMLLTKRFFLVDVQKSASQFSTNSDDQKGQQLLVSVANKIHFNIHFQVHFLFFFNIF